jgi:SAM-dependent methyltransferase
MCSSTCLEFVAQRLTAEEVRDKQVLEVGARNVNGSVRDLVQALQPKRYLGVDLVLGSGVDEVCDAVHLIDRFGQQSFDLVLSTEMLEHVRDWRAVIHNIKHVLRAGGWVYLTTRSEGFPYHEYPEDHWRYSVQDMQKIFIDFTEVEVVSDSREPGVFLKARRPAHWVENDLHQLEMKSV